MTLVMATRMVHKRHGELQDDIHMVSSRLVDAQ